LPRRRRRARHLRDLHRPRRLFGGGAGAARSEPAARRVADDDRLAVRVVRRDAAHSVVADGRRVRSDWTQGAGGRRPGGAGGGALYEIGGIRLPFLFVTALSIAVAALFLWVDLPAPSAEQESVPVSLVLRQPAVAACAGAVVLASGTLSMLEPVLALHLGNLG